MMAASRPAPRRPDPAPDDLPLSPLEEHVAQLVSELLVRAPQRRHALGEADAHPLSEGTPRERAHRPLCDVRAPPTLRRDPRR
jgi:hypothetical protein